MILESVTKFCKFYFVFCVIISNNAVLTAHEIDCGSYFACHDPLAELTILKGGLEWVRITLWIDAKRG